MKRSELTEKILAATGRFEPRAVALARPLKNQHDMNIQESIKRHRTDRSPKVEPPISRSDALVRSAGELSDHPIAGIFPLLAGPELRQLAESISESGLLEPIVLYQGALTRCAPRPDPPRISISNEPFSVNGSRTSFSPKYWAYADLA
jgi:hypothetical protein